MLEKRLEISCIIDASANCATDIYPPVFKTIQEGLEYCKVIATPILFIKKGSYKEKLIITQPNLTLVGEDALTTILTYDVASGTKREDGKNYGTTGSASTTIMESAKGFCAKNLTFENSFVRGTYQFVGEQAVAMKCEADQAVFYQCRFIGGQDTLYADAAAESKARQYYLECYVEGDVDFVFGRAQAVFDKCEFFSKNMGYNNTEDMFGYVTAPSTWAKYKYGYLIQNSRFTGEEEEGSTALGRPWQPGGSKEAKPAILIRECFMDQHIGEMGFVAMHHSKPEDARIFEYKNYGPGAFVNERRRQLDEETAKIYTMEQVFNADYEDDPWMPAITHIVE